MIKKDNCLLLGTLNKPHGTRGSMLLWFRNLKAEDIRKKDSVFVEIDGLLVPFFIESCTKNSKETAILKFEGINSESEAKAFAGLPVYMSNDQVRKKSASSPVVPTLSGFKVIDNKLGFVGNAVEIADIANNPLLVIRNEDKEFLIPIHEEIILDINNRKKEIRINAPEGLFEL